MKNPIALLFSTSAALCLLAGCASHKFQPTRADFLSTYNNLVTIDDTTSRYVNAKRLAMYSEFRITSVQVLVKDYDGQPITAEQQKKIADFVRASLTSALQDKYPVVNAPTGNSADIRIAVTDAYKSGSKMGISIEGEIEDSYSGVQVAAVVRTDLSSSYVGKWGEKAGFRGIVEGWSQNLRQAINSAHGQ